MMRLVLVLSALSACCGGCSGAFVLAVPDAAGPAGGDAAVTTRLMRNDFFLVNWPLKNEPVTFSLGEHRRASYTDDDGYASAALPVPETPGQYWVRVHHQDDVGDEGEQRLRLYSLGPETPTAVIDHEALEETDQPSRAGEQLHRLVAAGVQIVYVSDDSAAEVHDDLAGWACPDGPVLGWRVQRDWLGRRSGVKSPVTQLTRDVPVLAGVAGDDDAQRNFAALEIMPIALHDGPAIWAAVGANDWVEAVDRILAMLQAGDLTAGE